MPVGGHQEVLAQVGGVGNAERITERNETREKNSKKCVELLKNAAGPKECVLLLL